MGANSGKKNLKSKDIENHEFEEIKTNLTILKTIKSLYIVKEIFFFLNIKQRLSIIKYNKQLQEKLGIDIEEYKKISGKYKIIGKNGFGSEYILYTNILIFKGKYFKGVRNGKGKEYYYNSKLKFEGEYLNGKKWNGKGYNYKGNMLFEIKDGKGNIKEYTVNHELRAPLRFLFGYTQVLK